MKATVGLLGALALGALALGGLAGCAAPRTAWPRFEYSAPKMGTEFRLVLHAPDRASADAAAEAAWARIDELNAIFSDYEPASEISRLVRATGPVAVSPELFAVLELAESVARASDGAFDVTVGRLTLLWRRARRQEERPAQEALGSALAVTGWHKLRLDRPAGTAEPLRTGMSLDLGGIAKGWTLDAVLQLLRERGLPSALVDGGGDVAVSAPPPGRQGWQVAVSAGPAEVPQLLELAHAAVATSGDRFQFAEIDGVRYSHIVDPRTGEPLTGAITATVVAADAALADALASAASVLGPEQGIALLQHFSADGRILAGLPTETPRSAETPGFRSRAPTGIR